MAHIVETGIIQGVEGTTRAQQISRLQEWKKYFIAEGVENSNYLVRTTTAHYILTLYEKRVDEADLPFFIGLMTKDTLLFSI